VSKIGFIGLGVMGYPMAGHLARKGHDVGAYDVRAARVQEWLREFGGRGAPASREAARGAEVVFTCVRNDDDLRRAVLGRDGALGAMDGGATLVDHSSVSAQVTAEVAAAAREAGVGFLDAPLSGGRLGAEKGALTVMCGGDAALFERIQPLLGCYAQRATLMGPVGSGQLTKMVSQICNAGILQGLAEALNFGVRAGLDMEKVLHVLSKGASQSWQMDNCGLAMCRGQFDSGFAVDLMRKDLVLCLQTAREIGARLPVTALIDQFYAQLQARGGGQWSNTGLFHLLAHD